MNRHSRIFVAGHGGLVGGAIVRRLENAGYSNLLLRSRDEVDLTRRDEVDQFFRAERPEFVFLAAAKVGGIGANSRYPADFIYQNLAIELNVIDAAYRHGVEKTLFLGSSCIYPRLAEQPIHESSLLTGPLEPTNEWYAIAKIAGIKLIQAYRQQHGFNGISLMPTNLYGAGDDFDLETSHVLPALLRKFHDARESGARSVTIWGTGTPRREFLHVDDLADAAVFLMLHYDAPEIINVGCGEDLSIANLAKLIASVVGYRGELLYDRSKPDGTPRKLLDTGKLRALGWAPSIPLRAGIETTYRWYTSIRSRETISHAAVSQ